ncbi:MAG: TetR/AcrR family transcriptional regulator [Myxococcota bacterium]
MTARTQADRTAATRGALIDATLTLLVERGWAGITSVAVCERAGLTRGAFVHHFTGLPELFAAALEARYTTLAAASEDGAPIASVAGIVERMWESMVATDFKVVIEAWLAAANDPTLGEAIGPVIERFAKLMEPEMRSDVLPDEAAQSFFLLTRETLIGLALGRATNGGLPLSHEATVLGHLSRIANDHDARLARTAMENGR